MIFLRKKDLFTQIFFHLKCYNLKNLCKFVSFIHFLFLRRVLQLSGFEVSGF